MNDPDHITAYVRIEGDNLPERLDRLTAVAREIGGITIHAIRGIEADWLALSPAELDLQNRLDSALGAPLYSIGRPQQTGPLIETLGSRGVATIRDSLVYGKRTLLSGRINVTRRQLTQIETAVQNVCPELKLLDTPTARDIAKFCFSLEQVRAVVLPTFRQGIPMKYWMRDAQLTVGNVLEGTPEVQNLLGDDYVNCREDAIRFAAEFMPSGQI